MKRVFLGGTCGKSNWRFDLEKYSDIEYFNPVVDDWTEECQAIEIDEKENKCNIHLYVITSETDSIFSIAEAVDSSHNKNVTTIFCVMQEGFSKQKLKHLKAVVDLIISRDGYAMINSDLSTVSKLINLIKT